MREPQAWCSHGNHVGPCGLRYTQDFHDSVSYGNFPPTGKTVTLLVGVCQCEGLHE